MQRRAVSSGRSLVCLASHSGPSYRYKEGGDPFRFSFLVHESSSIQQHPQRGTTPWATWKGRRGGEGEAPACLLATETGVRC